MAIAITVYWPIAYTLTLYLLIAGANEAAYESPNKVADEESNQTADQGSYKGKLASSEWGGANDSCWAIPSTDFLLLSPHTNTVFVVFAGTNEAANERSNEGAYQSSNKEADKGAHESTDEGAY
jgi:hypothetical protein